MNLTQYFKSFLELLKTAEFSKGISFAVAAILPILLANHFGQASVGVAMAIGVLLSSPSDVPGSLERRMTGVFFSVIMATLGTLLAGYAAMSNVLMIPVLAVLIFGFSMISVFGFRASLIAFSGLFAIVLSLAKVPSEGSVLVHSLLVGTGGLWYLIFTVLLHFLTRRKETENLMAEGFELTAEYLQIRVNLMRDDSGDRESLKKELLRVQTSINENHELTRDVVISRRKNFGRSGVVRKKLLIFMDLIDILELGMANPVNYERMQQLFTNRKKELDLINDWSEAMVLQMKEISRVWRDRKTYETNPDLEEKRRKVWEAFRHFEKDARFPEERETILVFRNLIVFKEKQHQKIRSIERLLKEYEGKPKLTPKTKEAERFLTTQEYDFKTLLDNLDFKSPIFRHSLRLTVVLIAGLLLGRLFHFQNAYWILLTSLVIMRPGYALTRDRFKQRLYGTLIGGAIAVSIVLMVQNTMVYAVLAVITLVFAFSMIQRNYKAAAAFITLNVIFVYSLLRPNAFEVIQYRMLDTVLGAGLAFLGNKFFWPTWEYKGIKNYISASIQANLNYLQEIEDYYLKKGKLPTTYKLSRKQAFLKAGDLNAAFQRMAQEPEQGESDLGTVFKIVSVNQELLSASASLGTFIRVQTTTSASRHFTNYMRAIRENLQHSEEMLQEESIKKRPFKEEIEQAESYFKEKYEELVELRRKEKELGQVEISEDLRKRLQEIQIITDQLKWLLDLSENLKVLISKTAF
ncbi:FUSC family protein [Salinimicrobium gaetbulicola]|uniref:FUSC family membrane protein n=1 Tax=Salinimicrobium gaetbulicola TaxID=999702 RepID=A0ABW3ICG1_9FLAO